MNEFCVNQSDPKVITIAKSLGMSIESAASYISKYMIEKNDLNTIPTYEELLDFIDPKALQEATSLSDFHMLKMPNRDAKFTMSVMEMMNTLFMMVTFGPAFKTRVDELHDKKVSIGLRSEIYQAIYEIVSEEAINPEQTQEVRDNYAYVVRHFREATRLLDKRLEDYGLKVDFDTVKQMDTADNYNETTKLWSDASLEQSSKMNASKNTKLFIGSMTDYNKINEDFNIEKVVDFGPLFNKLVNVLSNTTSLTEKINVLLQYREKEPNFETVLDRLGLIDDDGNLIKDFDHTQVISLLQFNQTFSKHYYDYNMLKHDGNSSFASIDANTNSSRGRTLDRWKNNVDYTGPQYMVENNRSVYNPKYFQKYSNLIAQNRQYNNTVNNPSEYDKPVKDFLAELGIVFTESHPVVAYRYQEYGSNDLEKLIENLVKNIISGKTKFLFDRTLSDDGTIRGILAGLELANSLDAVENSHYANGKTRYNASLNNYLTLMIDEFNKATTKEQFLKDHPHLAIGMSNSVFMSNDYWKKGKRNDNKLNMIVEEVFLNKDGEGVEYDETTRQDKFIWEFTRIMNDNVFPFLRAGDNSVERALNIGQGSKFNTASFDKIADMFMGYVEDEIELISSYINSDTKYNQAIRLDGNPHKFSMFVDFFDEMAKKEFDKAVQGTKDINPNIIKSSMKRLMNENFDMQSKALADFTVNNGIVKETKKDSKEYELVAIPSLNRDNATIYNRDNLEKLMKVYLLKRFYGNIEQTKLFTGHPAFYKNPDDFFKRMSALVGTKEISTTSDINTSLDKLFENPKRLYKDLSSGDVFNQYSDGAEPIIRTVVFDDVNVASRLAESIKDLIGKEAYMKMNKGDAIGIIDMPTYRDMLLRSGGWTKTHEAKYAKEELGQLYFIWDGEKEAITDLSTKNPDGSELVFNMLKPQHFGPLAEDGFIPAMYKLSLLPLRKSYRTKYPSMGQLADLMDNKNAGILTFVSANKIGTKLNGTSMNTLYNGTYINDEREVLKITDDAVVQDTYFKYWGIQLSTGVSAKSEVTNGTQFQKHLYNGLFDKGLPVDETGNYSPEIEALANKMQSLQDERIYYGVEQLRKRFGLKREEDGNYTFDKNGIEGLINTLSDAAENRNADKNTLDTIQLLRDNIEQFGLDIIVNRDMLENIIMSVIDKEVFSRKMPGSAFIQAPGIGFEDVYEAEINGKKVLVSDNLKFYHEADGFMEVYIPNWFGEEVVDINDVDPELLKAVGFRIPTSGLNSIERIRVKGFLPKSAGDTIVLPSEIVEKAGSDFDVDKLNVFLKRFIKTSEGRFIPYSIDALYQEYKDVLRRKIRINVQADADRINTELGETGQVLAKSTGLDTDVDSVTEEIFNEKVISFEDFKAKKLKGERDIKQIDNEIIDTSLEILGLPQNKRALLNPVGTDMFSDLRDDINKQKGIERNINNSSMLNNALEGLSIKHRNIESKRGTGVAALQVTDHINAVRYGFKIKKHYLLPSNTEGDYTLLSGAKNIEGEYITDILNQFVNMFVDGAKDPIADELNFTLENANTVAYMLRTGVPLKIIGYLMNQPAIRDFTQAVEIRNSSYSEFESDESIVNRLKLKYGTPSGGFIYSESSLLKELQLGKTQNRPEQMLLLEAFLEYREDATEYSNYIQASRIDTEAAGKNSTELDYKLHVIDKMMEESVIENWSKVFEKGGYLHSRYVALKEVDKMLSTMYLYKKGGNQNMTFQKYNELIDYIYPHKKSVEDKGILLDKFKRDMLTSLFMTQQTIINGKQVTIFNEIPRLFFDHKGNSSLPMRIQKLINQGETNYLLRSLQPLIHIDEKVKGKVFTNLRLYDQRVDKIESDQLTDAWRELFQTHPDIAEDLVMFAIAQNGFQSGPMSFTKLIPYEYYIEMFTNLKSKEVGDNFLRDFALHNIDSDLIASKATIGRGFNGEVKILFRNKLSRLGKRFELVDEINNIKNPIDRDAKIKEYKMNGMQIFKQQPTIYVNQKVENPIFGFLPLSFEAPVIKDYRNMKALQLYGIMGKLQQIKDGSPLAEQYKKDVEALDFDFIQNFIKRCLK